MLRDDDSDAYETEEAEEDQEDPSVVHDIAHEVSRLREDIDFSDIKPADLPVFTKAVHGINYNQELLKLALTQDGQWYIADVTELLKIHPRASELEKLFKKLDARINKTLVSLEKPTYPSPIFYYSAQQSLLFILARQFQELRNLLEKNPNYTTKTEFKIQPPIGGFPQITLSGKNIIGQIVSSFKPFNNGEYYGAELIYDKKNRNEGENADSREIHGNWLAQRKGVIHRAMASAKLPQTFQIKSKLMLVYVASEDFITIEQFVAARPDLQIKLIPDSELLANKPDDINYYKPTYIEKNLKNFLPAKNGECYMLAFTEEYDNSKKRFDLKKSLTKKAMELFPDIAKPPFQFHYPKHTEIGVIYILREHFDAIFAALHNSDTEENLREQTPSSKKTKKTKKTKKRKKSHAKTKQTQSAFVEQNAEGEILTRPRPKRQRSSKKASATAMMNVEEDNFAIVEAEVLNAEDNNVPFAEIEFTSNREQGIQELESIDSLIAKNKQLQLELDLEKEMHQQNLTALNQQYQLTLESHQESLSINQTYQQMLEEQQRAFEFLSDHSQQMLTSAQKEHQQALSAKEQDYQQKFAAREQEYQQSLLAMEQHYQQKLAAREQVYQQALLSQEIEIIKPLQTQNEKLKLDLQDEKKAHQQDLALQAAYYQQTASAQENAQRQEIAMLKRQQQQNLVYLTRHYEQELLQEKSRLTEIEKEKESYRSATYFSPLSQQARLFSPPLILDSPQANFTPQTLGSLPFLTVAPNTPRSPQIATEIDTLAIPSPQISEMSPYVPGSLQTASFFSHQSAIAPLTPTTTNFPFHGPRENQSSRTNSDTNQPQALDSQESQRPRNNSKLPKQGRITTTPIDPPITKALLDELSRFVSPEKNLKNDNKFGFSLCLNCQIKGLGAKDHKCQHCGSAIKWYSAADNKLISIGSKSLNLKEHGLNEAYKALTVDVRKDVSSKITLTSINVQSNSNGFIPPRTP